MLVKANISFSGTSFNMAYGEVKECNDHVVLQDLLQAGYIEEVKEEETTPKGGSKNESKRSNSPKRS